MDYFQHIEQEEPLSIESRDVCGMKLAGHQVALTAGTYEIAMSESKEASHL